MENRIYHPIFFDKPGRISLVVSEGLPVKQGIYFRLIKEKETLEMRLSDINKAIETMDKNPEVSMVVDMLSKITHF